MEMQSSISKMEYNLAPRRRRRSSVGGMLLHTLLTAVGIGLILLGAVHLQDYGLRALRQVQPSEPVRETSDTQEAPGDVPEKLAQLWEKNPDARPFVEGWRENRGQGAPADLSAQAEGKEVPLLMQWDSRWGYTDYAGDCMGLTGCGPTCVSMASLYLTGNSENSPRAVADYAQSKGYAVDGSGSAWKLISEGASAFGMTARELPLSEEGMKGTLDQGGLVICVLGPGDFTDSGHFILITGYDGEGFRVNDPNSYVRSEQHWSYETLSGQIKNLWEVK